MRAVCLSLALAAVGADAWQPRTNGCAAYRCDASASSSSALSLPIACITTFTARLPRAPSTLNLSSTGCVSQAGSLVCTYPLLLDPTSVSWAGLVRLDASGRVVGNYTDVGSGHCLDQFGASGGRGTAVPVMDVAGDVVLLDTGGVSLVQGLTAAWTAGLFPGAYCPDTLPSVSVSSGKLLMYIGSLGEVFGYYVDSVPVGDLNLFANASQPPGPIPGGFQPHAGLLVPISQQAVVDPRTLLLTRYYTVDGYESRPVLTATPDLRLSATDLQDEKVPRIARPWTLPLPLPPDVGGACMPTPPSNPIYAGKERLVVEGPVALATGMVVLAMLCPTVSTAVHVYGVQVANETSFADGGGGGGGGRGGEVGPPVPSIVWTLDVPVTDGAGAASFVHIAVDASQLPPLATTFWLCVGERVMAVDGPTGRVTANVSLTSTLQAHAGWEAHRGAPSADGSCSAWLGSVGAPLAHATGGGPLLTSAPAASASSRVDAPPPNATSLALPVLLTTTTGAAAHAVLHLFLSSGGDAGQAPASVAWCALTPGSVAGRLPVEGQMTVMEWSGGTTTLAVVTQEGVFGVGG